MQPAVRWPTDEASIVSPIMARLSFVSPQQLCHASIPSNLPKTVQKFTTIIITRQPYNTTVGYVGTANGSKCKWPNESNY